MLKYLLNKLRNLWDYVRLSKLERQQLIQLTRASAMEFEREVGRDLAAKYRVTAKTVLTIPVAVTFPLDLHPDTVSTVIKTTEALAQKLYVAQTKHGLVNGWRYSPSDKLGDGRFFLTEEHLQKAFIEHVNKGDHLDVIAYVAFALELGFKLPQVKNQ